MTPYPLIFSVYVLETRIFFSHNHGMSNKNTNFSTILLSNPQSNAQALPVTPPPKFFTDQAPVKVTHYILLSYFFNVL